MALLRKSLINIPVRSDIDLLFLSVLIQTLI
jgi:hypothetical protein